MATWKLKADARDVREIVGASLAVHFFSPRPAVDHVVACLTCRNAAEQSFVCQHGGAPWLTVREVPGGSSPELVPGGLYPQRIVTAPTFEVIRAAGTLDGEAFGPRVGVFRQSLERVLQSVDGSEKSPRKASKQDFRPQFGDHSE